MMRKLLVAGLLANAVGLGALWHVAHKVSGVPVPEQRVELTFGHALRDRRPCVQAKYWDGAVVTYCTQPVTDPSI